MTQFDRLNLNVDLLNFTLYLCQNDGAVLATILHELYHKWQFNSSKFLYMINTFVFMLFGYAFSTKSRYSTEGDVRIFIDNEVLHKIISKFYRMLHSYLFYKNRLIAFPDDEELKARMEELKAEDDRMLEFVKKIVSKLEITGR